MCICTCTRVRARVYACMRVRVYTHTQSNVFGSANSASCVFTHGFFLDIATSMTLELDTCNVRFLPANLADGIDKEITSPKVLFSFTQNDADITLSSDTCTAAATMSLTNTRPDMLRYQGFYCTVHVMVPSRIVFPGFLPPPPPFPLRLFSQGSFFPPSLFSPQMFFSAFSFLISFLGFSMFVFCPDL